MDTLPNKVLLQIFSYLPHKEILKSAQVCKKWRAIAYDSRLWKAVSLRPSYGGLEIPFLTDEHIESVAASLPLLESLSFNFCQAVTGSCLKQLLQRCKRLRSLHMEQTTLNSKHVIAAEWEKTSIEELNIAATDVSSECLTSVLTRLPNLRWLSAGVLEHFTDQVLESWMKSGNCSKLVAIDLDTCDMLTDSALTEFIKRHGHQLTGLNLGGNEKLLEQFWLNVLPMMHSLELLIIGMAEDCCPKVKVKIHIDQLIDSICQHVPKIKQLEVRWDSDKLRFSDKSSKFIDLLRMKCLCLQSLVLSDGEYYEVVHSNFERADRETVVKTTAHCQTTLVPLLKYYNDLLFN